MHIARAGAYAASLGLALAAIGLAGAPAQAVPPDPVGADTAAGWLSDQLVLGLVDDRVPQDYLEQSVLLAFAMHAVEQDARVTQIANALRGEVGDFTRFQKPDGTTYTRADHVAELGVLADIVHSPTSFGGHDLVSETAARISTTAPVAGRLEDDGTDAGHPDTATTLGQAYAVRLLTATGQPEAASARDFLLGLQCPNGSFAPFVPDKTDSDQGCHANSDGDLETTAVVVLQLSELPEDSTLVADLTQARSWVASQQDADGSWPGPGGPGGPGDTVLTGLAAQALDTDTDLTYDTELGKAASWLRGRQATYYDVCDELGRERGAVAGSQSELDSARAAGLGDFDDRGAFIAATTSALPALQNLPAGSSPSVPDMTGPTGYQQAGSDITLTISGLHAGDGLCLNSGSTFTRQFAATGPSMTRSVTLPLGTATRAYGVRDADGDISYVHVSVLGQKTLTVARTPGTVHRNGTITAAIHGLAPGEQARIYYGYDLVRSGTASDSGNFVAYVPAGTALGRHYLRGYGQFGGIRKGHTTVTVVR